MSLSKGEKAGLAVGMAQLKSDVDGVELALDKALHTIGDIPADDPDVQQQLAFYRGLLYAAWLWSLALDKELRGLTNKFAEIGESDEVIG